MGLAFVPVMLTMGSVFAQGTNYPAKAIRWVVPFPPGGSGDVLARLVSPKLAEALGQQVIVDNRSGASGTIGTVAVARSAPDGYTVLSNTLPFVANPALHSKPPYDVLRDFEPVMLMVNQGPMIALHPSMPEVPTVIESGVPGFEFSAWHWLMAPKGTPRAVVNTLNAKMKDVLRLPDTIQRTRHEAFDIMAGTPDDLAILLAAEVKKYARLVKERKMQIE